MQELIVVESTPALLSVNFEEAQKHLAAKLEKYNVVVTQDTVKDAKALVTELNKLKKEISDKRKAVVAQVSEPVKAFDAQMKELEAMCSNGGQALKDQVAKFENELKATAMEMCSSYLEATWEKLEVQPPYRSARVDDLVNLSTLTAKGNLTGKVQSAIESRVMANKALQDQTNMRLLKLENESYKAGLSAPLTRTHVEAFLFEDDELYQSKLATLFAGELEREKIAQENMRKKLEQEQQQKVVPIATTPEQSVPAEETVPQAEPEPTHVEAQPDQSGKIPITITCTFDTVIDHRVSDELVQQKLTEAMTAAGITTLSSISVQRFSAAG